MATKIDGIIAIVFMLLVFFTFGMPKIIEADAKSKIAISCNNMKAEAIKAAVSVPECAN